MFKLFLNDKLDGVIRRICSKYNQSNVTSLWIVKIEGNNQISSNRKVTNNVK